MVDKSSFTPQEWTLLMEGVMAAGMAVTMADPSGLLGVLKEGFASAQALVQAKRDPGADALVKAIVMDFEAPAARNAARDGLKARFGSAKKPPEIKAKCIDLLREVSTLLDQKAPADAAAFKGWLRQVGQRVAEAASEGGGLLGIGGVQVSDAEKATLAEISSALKLAA
jgi:hypothetical protein